MNDAQALKAAVPPDQVLVRCVWQPGRGPKDDCRGGTGVRWKGHGDIQLYPAILWGKLAAFPDVWELFNPDEAEARIAAAETANAQAKTEAAQRAAEEEAKRKAQAEADAELAARLAAEAAANGGDAKLATIDLETATLTEEILQSLSDTTVREIAEKRGYELHHRLAPENLRRKFLEKQAEAAGA